MVIADVIYNDILQYVFANIGGYCEIKAANRRERFISSCVWQCISPWRHKGFIQGFRHHFNPSRAFECCAIPHLRIGYGCMENSWSPAAPIITHWFGDLIVTIAMTGKLSICNNYDCIINDNEIVANQIRRCGGCLVPMQRLRTSYMLDCSVKKLSPLYMDLLDIIIFYTT